MILEKYCNDNNLKIVEVYVDDGFSGLNFNTPSFQRLLQDIDSGKIYMVITKDLSRWVEIIFKQYITKKFTSLQRE